VFSSYLSRNLCTKFVFRNCFVYERLRTICEISSSHGGEYDVQSCLLGCTADNHFTRQYNPKDSSEHHADYVSFLFLLPLQNTAIDVFALGRQGWGDHRRMENRDVVHRNHGVKYRTEGCIGTETMIVMLETSPSAHTVAPRRMYVLHPYGALLVSSANGALAASAAR
jgi:hypothetical protein